MRVGLFSLLTSLRSNSPDSTATCLDYFTDGETRI